MDCVGVILERFENGRSIRMEHFTVASRPSDLHRR